MQTQNLSRVVLWMVGALLSFCLMAVSVRQLADRLSVFEMLTFRSGIGLVVLVVFAIVRPEFRPAIPPQRIGLYLFRNCIHYAGQCSWALGLTLLPLATVFALEFTMPAWTVLLAAWLLKERLTSGRIAVVVMGLIGVLVILRPGIATLNLGVAMCLLAAIFYSFTMITTKELTKTETTFNILLWMNVIQLPLSLIASHPSSFLTLEWHHLLPALGMGITGLTSHFCLSNAFRAGDASVVVPIDFMRVPLIALIGWLFYNEAVDIFVFIGAGIIVAGIVWNLRAESARTAA